MAACAVALLALLVAAGTARGQMPADALGKPLPSDQLPDGTMTVRVFDGGVDKPVDGLVVTLQSAAGKQRNARTDAKGRALFAGLPGGSTWVASVSRGDAEAASEEIEIPASGGVQVVLSLSEWTAPATGDGRPEPQQMASRPRGEQSLSAGSLQVRVVDGVWEKPVGDHPVHLVGFRADGQVAHKVANTDESGRVLFEGLRGRDVAYYVLTLLDGPGGLQQRLMSVPTQLLPRVGIAMVLSGAKPDAEQPEDDLNEFYRDQFPPPKGPGPGKVEFRIGGDPAQVDLISEVELIEVSSPDVIARAAARSDSGQVEGGFVVEPRDNPNTGPGVAMVGVLRSTGNNPPVEGATVELMPAGAPPGTDPIVQTSDNRGIAEFPGLQVGATYTPTVVLFGQRIEGPSFTMPEKVGIVTAAALKWEGNVKVANFSALPWGGDKVYVGQVRSGGRVHRSPPFQLTRGQGAVVPLPVSGEPAFRFHLGAVIHDEFLQFEGTFVMTNGPVAPFSFGEDVEIPLPDGFVGVRIADEFSARVKEVPGKGLVWKGAVPPGGLQFNLAFTMRIEDGLVPVDWSLPYGATSSSLVFEWHDQMKVEVVGKAAGKVDERSGRKVYVMSNINIPPQRRMVMRVSGLPQPPAWYDWVKLAIGLVVVVLITAAVVSIFSRRTRQQGARSHDRRVRKEQLLDQLAELERAHRDGKLAEGKYRKQRSRIVKQLEPLYASPADGGGQRSG